MRITYPCWLVIFLFTIKVSSIELGSPCNMARYLAVFGGGFVPTCRPDGSYEEIQCYETSCWCVEVNGEEKKNTRTTLPDQPNCEYTAYAATEVDIIRVIAEEKGDEIKLLPDAFMSRAAYLFPPSTSINTQLKKHFPPVLWPDFSILITVKPEEIAGGVIFAIMDALESVIQFGVILSAGDNDYTQVVELWYTEDIEQGATKLIEFTVPSMVDRWSKFAVGVFGEEINLFMYCHNYTMTTVERMADGLKFAENSLLLVGHAGNVLQQHYKGEIQEILLTNNADDAARQCDESFQIERQEVGIVEVDVYEDLDTETDDEDVTFSGDMEYADQPTIIPLLTQRKGNPFKLYTTTVPYPIERSTVQAMDSLTPVDGDIWSESVPTAMKGDKGETGEPGLPGAPGINGIPGQMGEIGPQGPMGIKGEKGETGIGLPGEKGKPGDTASGKTGDKGEPGASVVGPQGPPGASLMEELRNIQSLDDQLLTSRLERLVSFVGPKGEPGVCKNITGKPGKDGRDGPIGMPGFPGAPGKPGQQGERGYDGEPGTQGQQGIRGPLGDTGAAGPKGEQGMMGPQGIQGSPGEPGKLITNKGEEVILLPGPRGIQGLRGERGYKGESGDRGVKGSTGAYGPPGPVGILGPRGNPGLEGLTGYDGRPGLPGRKGKAGKDGNKGEKGELGVGLPGPPGPPGNSVGKPFFGAEWFDENYDEQLAKIKGESGVKGEAGSPGKVSYEDVAELMTLFVTKGEKGDAGGSAECKACSGGKGDAGPPGKKGSHGPKGVIGMSGFPGRDGVPGESGSPGLAIRGPKGEPGVCLGHQCSGVGQKGDAGLDGLPGLSGLNGEQGSKGTSGEKGERGTQGPPGEAADVDGIMPLPGLRGPPGPPGRSIVGLQGPPGPSGSPGLPGRDGSSYGNSPAQNSYSHGYDGSESGVLLFTNQDDMSRASLAIPIGTLGYVSDQQRLYLRVPLGWQAVQMGHVVPLLESEMANIIPMWMDAPAKEHSLVQQPSDDVPVLRIFALNEPMTGNLGGIAGADGHCYRQAVRSGVIGEFRAVLTSRLQDVESIVFSKYRDLPVVNSKGEYVLKTWSSISDGKSDLVRGATVYTFDGTNTNTDNRWHRKYIWHGAQRTGHVAVNEYCQAWTSDSSRELGASSSLTHGQLLDQSSHTCDTLLAVLCIEIHT